jgi:hypothetical protein
MKLSLATNFGAKLSFMPCPFVSWMLSTNHCCCCSVYCSYKCPHAFNAESQYFIPRFSKISWLCRQQPGGDEASNEGFNSGPTEHDFTDNSNTPYMMPIWQLCFIHSTVYRPFYYQCGAPTLRNYWLQFHDGCMESDYKLSEFVIIVIVQFCFICEAVFFQKKLWYCHIGDHPQVDLATFGYGLTMKV